MKQALGAEPKARRSQFLGTLLSWNVSPLPTLAPNLSHLQSFGEEHNWEGAGVKSLSTKQLSYSNPFPDVEWMPIHTRACVGTVIGYIYSVGQFILAGVAYAVPHWRHLQLLVSVPYFVAFIYSWYVEPGVGSNGPEPYRVTRDRPSLRAGHKPPQQLHP